jgi:hypothetical protein
MSLAAAGEEAIADAGRVEAPPVLLADLPRDRDAPVIARRRGMTAAAADKDLFPLGKVIISPRALRAFERAFKTGGDLLLQVLNRHRQGSGATSCASPLSWLVAPAR